MTTVPLQGSNVKDGKPSLTKEEYIEMMEKKGFHFDKKDEPQKYWIVTKITTKCPVCSREYEETGKYAEETLSSVMTCASCGFKGDIGL